MQFDQELVAELNLLVKFSLSSEMTGLKIHSDADPCHIEAAKRLFDKKLITLEDGGYLTALGREAAEHARLSLRILVSNPEL